MHFHLVVRQIEGDTRHVQKIVREVFLDHIALVTEANDEIVNAMMRIHFHDVPQNRLAADFDHRFGLQMRFLADTRAQPACQNNGFHSGTRFVLWCVIKALIAPTQSPPPAA